MKSKYILAGLLTLTIVALACIASVAANGDEYDYYVQLTCTPAGVTWTFSTDGSFSGKEIVESSIVAEYWLEEGGYIFSITPRQIILTDKLVTLVFNPADLPVHASARVTGKLTDDETFLAFGGSFAFGRRP